MFEAPTSRHIQIEKQRKQMFFLIFLFVSPQKPSQICVVFPAKLLNNIKVYDREKQI